MSQELIVEVYQRLAASCKTVNELNWLNMRLENRMTPREKLVLLKALEDERLSLPARGYHLLLKGYHRVLGSKKLGWIPRRIPASKLDLFEARKSWARRLRNNSIASDSQVAEWARVPILPGVVLYRRVDVATPRLIVSFTGARARMMIALPDYLSAIERTEADVLLIRTDRSGGYLKGLPESLGALEPSIRVLEAIIKKHGYTDLRVVGTSGGALPALTSSAYLLPSVVLVVGPPHGHFSKFGEELVHLLKTQPGLTSTRWVVAYGSDFEDEESATLLSDSLGAECMRIEGARHAAMRELDDQFSLARTLMAQSDEKTD
jgi:hypothetical protein